MWEVTYPVYTLALLGVKTLVITNACGGIDRTLSPGDLMLLSDHINMLGINSLIGPNDERFGPRLPDMTEVYSRRLREKAHAAAASLGFQCKEGVYAIFSGPCYETAAEIRAYAHLGADAIGMSTVPEAIAAAHCGYEILGVTLCANMAAGVLPQPLSGEEVNEMAEQSAPHFSSLILGCLERL